MKQDQLVMAMRMLMDDNSLERVLDSIAIVCLNKQLEARTKEEATLSREWEENYKTIKGCLSVIEGGTVDGQREGATN